MATISSLFGAAGVGAALIAVAPLAVHLLPPPWTHTLAASNCQWHPKPWAARLGAPEGPRYTLEGEHQWAACQRARGLKSRLPVLKTVLARWPSRAELAALSRQDSTEDENRSPLPAHGQALAGDVPPDRAG